MKKGEETRRQQETPSVDLSFLLLQLLRQLGHLLKQVADKPHVRDLEDGRVRVLVDGRDDLAVLHARQVLDRPRDAHGQVQLRRDVLARLADLQAVVREAAVDGGAGRTDRRAQRVRQRRDEPVKLLLRLQATAAGHDALRGGQVRTLGLGELLGHPLGRAGGVGVRAVDDLGGAALCLGALEGGASDGDQLDGVSGLDGQDGVAGVDGADKGCSVVNIEWSILSLL